MMVSLSWGCKGYANYTTTAQLWLGLSKLLQTTSWDYPYIVVVVVVMVSITELMWYQDM